MKKFTLVFFALAICLGITINGLAQNQKRKPTPSPTPSPSPTPTDVFVEAKLEPNGIYGANKLTMENDTALPYVHGVNGVEARFFGASRDLVIRLTNSTRSMLFDMRDISNTTVDTPAWVYTPFLSKPHFNVLKAYYAKEGCPRQGDEINGFFYNCDFVTRTNGGYMYAASGASYALLWNPETENPRPVNSPEMTSFVKVNYYKGTDGKEVFTISPLPNCATRAKDFICDEFDANGVPIVERVIAGLERSKGNSVTNAGQYVMPFTLVVRPLQ